MGQNDSRHKNLPPGYQNYDPQMINNYLAYQHRLNPHFFMQGPYHNNGFPSESVNTKQGEMILIYEDSYWAWIKILSKTGSKNNPVNATGDTRENSHYQSDSQNKKVVQPKNSMLQELLECPICMNIYDNPHVLPCQHTFCKGCIVSLKNNDKTASETIR